MIPLAFYSQTLHFIFASLELPDTLIVILSREPAFPRKRDDKLLEFLRQISILILNLRDWSLLTDVEIGFPED